MLNNHTLVVNKREQKHIRNDHNQYSSSDGLLNIYRNILTFVNQYYDNSAFKA